MVIKPCIRLAAIAALVNHHATRRLAYELAWIAIHIAIHLLFPHVFLLTIAIEATIAVFAWAIEVRCG